MALDPRIILGMRPLDTPAEMDDQRRRRDIADQEVQLRRQEIELRGQALRDAAEARNRPPAYDPLKMKQEAEYQSLLGNSVAEKFRAAEANPEAWPAVRRYVGQLAGPQAIANLPEDWNEAAPIVHAHVLAWPAHEAEIRGQLINTVNAAGEPVQRYVQPKVGEEFPVAPPKPAAEAKPPNVGTFEDYITRTYGASPTSAQILEGRKQFNQSDDRPATTIRMSNGMTPGQAFSSERQLRNDFARETKSAQTVAQQLALMESSLAAVKAGKSTAGSQGVLVTFQKILDPTSVVRESEYARSASGLSLLGQIEGKWDQIKNGGAGVTAADLEQFVSLARTFNKNQQAFAKQTKDQIDAVAKEYGLDPSRITKDTDVQTPRAESPASPGGTAAPAKPPVNPFRKK